MQIIYLKKLVHTFRELNWSFETVTMVGEYVKDLDISIKEIVARRLLDIVNESADEKEFIDKFNRIKI